MVRDINEFCAYRYREILEILENGNAPDQTKLRSNKAYAIAWNKLSRCSMPYLNLKPSRQELDYNSFFLKAWKDESAKAKAYELMSASKEPSLHDIADNFRLAGV